MKFVVRLGAACEPPGEILELAMVHSLRGSGGHVTICGRVNHYLLIPVMKLLSVRTDPPRPPQLSTHGQQRNASNPQRLHMLPYV